MSTDYETTIGYGFLLDEEIDGMGELVDLEEILYQEMGIKEFRVGSGGNLMLGERIQAVLYPISSPTHNFSRYDEDKSGVFILDKAPELTSDEKAELGLIRSRFKIAQEFPSVIATFSIF